MSGQWINDEDRALIKAHFKDNVKLLLVIKKFLLPAYSDPNMPFEFTSDAFMKGLRAAELSVEEIKAIVMARQELMQWIGQAFAEISIIANSEDETDQESENRRDADDTH